MYMYKQSNFYVGKYILRGSLRKPFARPNSKVKKTSYRHNVVGRYIKTSVKVIDTAATCSFRPIKLGKICHVCGKL